jgi:hypothetical protein
MKARKKPVIIEFVHWSGNILSEVPAWLELAMRARPGSVGSVFRWGDKIEIQTLEGAVMASPGDYIIQGVKGELYPCKPDIFAATYDVIHDTPSCPRAGGETETGERK